MNDDQRTVAEVVYEALLMGQVDGDLSEKSRRDNSFTYEWPYGLKCDVCGADVTVRGNIGMWESGLPGDGA